MPDNAIYELADALAKVRAYDFPVQMTDTTRAYFRTAGKARGDDIGPGDGGQSPANPTDKAAETRLVDADKSYHSMLRTTCVATLLDGGHANNALPQRAACQHQLPHLSRRIGRSRCSRDARAGRSPIHG